MAPAGRALCHLAGGLSAGFILACGGGEGGASGPSGTTEGFAVAAASDFSCAVDPAGEAWCWGWGASGQLGNGTYLNRSVPERVVAPLAFQEIEAGSVHACGLDLAGAPWCWGSNASGALGLGVLGGRDSVPRQVVGGHQFKSITSGGIHTCGLTPQGEAWCWGAGADGALGQGDTVTRAAPTQVSGFVFAAITAGTSHTCALATDGAAWCWGRNFRGQLGTGDESDALSPRPVSSTLRFVTIGAGGFHTCALAGDGSAWCWGNDSGGELGDGRAVSQPVVAPVAVSGDHQFRRLSVGNYHACGITASGAAWCWGSSLYGKLGNGDQSPTVVPVGVVTGHRLVSISAGSNHTCAGSESGRVLCWGRNSLGQLGTGDFADQLTPAVSLLFP